jgi:phospholipid N-methyltransferase
MGTSLRGGKPEIAAWFKDHEASIDRVIDIGAGSGTYVKLVRHEYNICKDSLWTAIEAWEPYISEFKLNSLYDQVINVDARTLNWEDLGKFSVAVAGDVLEHMTKQEAIQLVEQILENCKVLIISIPIVYMPQDEINGNPFEIHVKPDWSHDEVLETWKDKIKSFYRKSPKSKIAVYWLSK